MVHDLLQPGGHPTAPHLQVVPPPKVAAEGGEHGEVLWDGGGGHLGGLVVLVGAETFMMTARSAGVKAASSCSVEAAEGTAACSPAGGPSCMVAANVQASRWQIRTTWPNMLP